MRNILFLVIMIVTVAVAVSCNVQNSADKDGSVKTVSEKQEKGSVETPKIFTKIVENDNGDIVNRLNEIEEQLSQRIDSITLNVDNTEVLSKLDELKSQYDVNIAKLNDRIAASDAKRKEQFYQVLVAILSATIALLVVLLITYRYLKKFIAEAVIIYSHKPVNNTPSDAISTDDSDDNNISEKIHNIATSLNNKINSDNYLFDPEKAVKLNNSQKAELAEIISEINFLEKAGYELSHRHNYLIALDKVNEKNYTDATLTLDKIKESDETYTPAYFLSGYIAYVSRKYDTAIENLKKACEQEPENAAYLISYGNACLKEKKYEEAADALKKAVEIKPDDASTWNNLAHAYIVSDKMDNAVEAFGKAAELKPDFHEALHNLGLALGKLEKYEEAAEAFTKAIEAKNDKHESMYNAACVYALLGKRDGALSNLKKAIELQPEYSAKAKKDKDFSSFKDDEEFKQIIG